MTPEDERLALLVGYLEDELDPEEREQVEAWLAEDPEARETLAAYEGLGSALGALPQLEPAPAARDAAYAAVMAAMEEATPVEQPAERTGGGGGVLLRFLSAAAAAALVLVVALAGRSGPGRQAETASAPEARAKVQPQANDEGGRLAEERAPVAAPPPAGAAGLADQTVGEAADAGAQAGEEAELDPVPEEEGLQADAPAPQPAPVAPAAPAPAKPAADAAPEPSEATPQAAPVPAGTRGAPAPNAPGQPSLGAGQGGAREPLPPEADSFQDEEDQDGAKLEDGSKDKANALEAKREGRLREALAEDLRRQRRASRALGGKLEDAPRDAAEAAGGGEARADQQLAKGQAEQPGRGRPQGDARAEDAPGGAAEPQVAPSAELRGGPAATPAPLPAWLVTRQGQRRLYVREGSVLWVRSLPAAPRAPDGVRAQLERDPRRDARPLDLDRRDDRADLLLIASIELAAAQPAPPAPPAEAGRAEGSSEAAKRAEESEKSAGAPAPSAGPAVQQEQPAPPPAERLARAAWALRLLGERFEGPLELSGVRSALERVSERERAEAR